MHRFDLQDWQWELICDLFPSNDGKEGGQWKDHRTVLNGMFHVLHTGCPWRDLPAAFGNWNTVFKRFRHWVKADVFKRIFEALSGDPDLEYAMIDGSIVKVHRHGQGAKGGLRARPSAARAAAGPPRSSP